MADHDYSSMSDEELLKEAESAGVAPHPTPTAAPATLKNVTAVSAPPQEDSSVLTDPHTWEGAAGAAGAAALATKFPALRAAVSRFTMNAPVRQTAEAVLKDVGDSQAAAQRLRDIANRLRTGTSPQTVGDVITPQGQRLAQQAIAEPNPQSAAYAQQLEQRQTQAPQRAESLVRGALNAPQEFTTQEQQFLTDQKARAQPLYDAAFNQFPSVKAPTLTDILNDPAGQAASKTAVTELARRGQNIGPVTPGGMVENPSLAYMDQVKRELDKQIGAFRRAAVMGNDPTARAKAASLSGLRDKFVTELDQATTGANGISPYATARAQFASDQKVIDALRSGHDDFDSLSPAELRASLNGLTSTAERDAFRSGVAENLLRKIGRTPDSRPGVDKLIQTPDVQAKLTSLFDTPQGADNFTQALERESQMFHFGRDMQAAAGQGTVPASGINAGQVAHMTVNPKLAALRLAARQLLGPRKIPAAGITDIMSQSGVQGAATLEDLARAVQRLRP